jgi:hypothetical protein
LSPKPCALHVALANPLGGKPGGGRKHIQRREIACANHDVHVARRMRLTLALRPRHRVRGCRLWMLSTSRGAFIARCFPLPGGMARGTKEGSHLHAMVRHLGEPRCRRGERERGGYRLQDTQGSGARRFRLFCNASGYPRPYDIAPLAGAKLERGQRHGSDGGPGIGVRQWHG